MLQRLIFGNKKWEMVSFFVTVALLCSKHLLLLFHSSLFFRQRTMFINLTVFEPDCQRKTDICRYLTKYCYKELSSASPSRRRHSFFHRFFSRCKCNPDHGIHIYMYIYIKQNLFQPIFQCLLKPIPWLKCEASLWAGALSNGRHWSW